MSKVYSTSYRFASSKCGLANVVPFAMIDGMKDTKANRRRNLFKLTRAFGSLEKFQAATGVKASYASQLKHDRNMGEKVARRIEERLCLADGWMDAATHDDEAEVLERIAQGAERRRPLELSPAGSSAHALPLERPPDLSESGCRDDNLSVSVVKDLFGEQYLLIRAPASNRKGRLIRSLVQAKMDDATLDFLSETVNLRLHPPPEPDAPNH